MHRPPNHPQQLDAVVVRLAIVKDEQAIANRQYQEHKTLSKEKGSFFKFLVG
jgi:hypothetical protein